MSLIGLLVVLIVGCAVIWAAGKILGAFGIGEPAKTVVYVLIVLIVVLWAVAQLGGVNLGGLRF